MRSFLIWLVLVGTSFGQLADGDISHLGVKPDVPVQTKAPEPLWMGWIPHKPKPRSQTIYDRQLQDLVRYNDDGDALNYRFLYEALKKSGQLTDEEVQTKRLNSLNQKNVGSCVGYGTTIALDVVAASNVFHRKQLNQIWLSRCNPDAIYAITRADNLGRWDGSTGAWAADNIQQYGTLHHLEYGSHDLRSTQPTDGRAWSSSGLPKELLEAAGEHKAINCALVKNPEECKAALQNGYAIFICSGISYSETRDSNGFSRRTPQGWAHCMGLFAYRGKASGKEGFLIINSWGNNWNQGPVWPDDMPHGAFWITPEDLQVQLNADDSYAIGGYDGFKRRVIKWDDVFNFNGEIKDE